MSYSYDTIRRFSSNCHVFTFKPTDFRFDVTLGATGALEKLSTIKGEIQSDEYVLAKINGEIFRNNGTKQVIGLYVDSGVYSSESLEFYPVLTFWKNGVNANKLTITKNPTTAQILDYQRNAYWAIGTLWSLIIDGKQNYTYPKETVIKVFSHAATRQPRTMIGQKIDGTIIWVVVDGRIATSLGVTIDQEYSIMNELGCVTAVNVDGGGSSEMIINDSIVNKPSDGCERPIGTAFVCYGKKNTTVSSTKGIVNASLLNVRSGPGTNYSKVGSLARNSVVYVVESTGMWYKIIYGKEYAYVSKSYIILNS